MHARTGANGGRVNHWRPRTHWARKAARNAAADPVGEAPARHASSHPMRKTSASKAPTSATVEDSAATATKAPTSATVEDSAATATKASTSPTLATRKGPHVAHDQK